MSIDMPARQLIAVCLVLVAYVFGALRGGCAPKLIVLVVRPKILILGLARKGPLHRCLWHTNGEPACKSVIQPQGSGRGKEPQGSAGRHFHSDALVPGNGEKPEAVSEVRLARS